MLAKRRMSSDSNDAAAVKALGRRIRVARELAGLKQAELARRCGVIPTTAWRWEDGRTEPDVPTLRRIARATGAGLGWLVSGDAA